jgi:hypothetical protein
MEDIETAESQNRLALSYAKLKKCDIRMILPQLFNSKRCPYHNAYVIFEKIIKMILKLKFFSNFGFSICKEVLSCHLLVCMNGNLSKQWWGN